MSAGTQEGRVSRKPALTPHEIAVKLLAKSAPAENGCRVWLGARSKGYGTVDLSRRTHRAHRVSYETFVGPIPDGLVLDHLCRNRPCIEPTHLEPVTIGENVLRGEGITAQQARQTHCKNGHPLPHATLIDRHTYIKRERLCLVCRQISERARKARLAQPGTGGAA